MHTAIAARKGAPGVVQLAAAPSIWRRGGMEVKEEDSGDGEPEVVKQASLKNELPKTLSFLDSGGIIVGIIIGSGIFASPGVVLSRAGSVPLSFLVWVLGGLLSLAGGLCYSELGTSIPESGGEYVYLTKAYSPAVGFCYTWTRFFVTKTGSLAIISIIFARYAISSILGKSQVDGDLDGSALLKLTAIAAVLCVSTVNGLSTRAASSVQKAFTFLKLGLVAFIIVLGGFWLAIGETSVASENLSGFFEFKNFSVANFGFSLVAALWAYDGWCDLNSVAEEVRNPARNIPLAVVGGVALVTTAYLLVNIAYLIFLPAELVMESQSIAVTIGERALGSMGGRVVGLGVAASAFGALNGSCMTGARVFFAAARHGKFPFSSWVGWVAPRTGTPVVAIALQAAMSILLIIPGRFESLVSFFGFTAYIFYAAVAASVLHLRAKYPELPRPFKVQSRAIPVLFVAVAAFMIASAMWVEPLVSLLAVAFILLSFPVYWFFFRGTQEHELLEEEEMAEVVAEPGTATTHDKAEPAPAARSPTATPSRMQEEGDRVDLLRS